MKKTKLILHIFLALTVIFFCSCGSSSSFGRNKSSESIAVVTIGNQVWTSKNLNVDTYSNGDSIPQVQDPIKWANLSTGAWCYYDNDTSNGNKYGKLYNWYAVHDTRGLAPKGYHLSTAADWEKLTHYLGGELQPGTGSKMKSTSGWNNDGNGTNISGFSGLPAGCRGTDGSFYNIYEYGYWWSTIEDSTRDETLYILHYKIGISEAYDPQKKCGFSVRCLKD